MFKKYFCFHTKRSILGKCTREQKNGFRIRRKNSGLPRDAIVTNYNRVLVLPRVRVEDGGEYVCTAHNDKVSITGSVVLSIKAR
jgi:hypothetical protein